MENNIENKSKFFAQYYGQNVYRHNAWNQCRESIEVNVSSISNCSFGYLELNNISSISDEDAIEVAKILTVDIFVKGAIKVYKIKRTSDFVLVDITNDYSKMVKNIYPKIDHLITVDATNIRFLFGSNPDYDKAQFAVEYLRSKGYVLPFMGLTVETLIEYGWVKFKVNA